MIRLCFFAFALLSLGSAVWTIYYTAGGSTCPSCFLVALAVVALIFADSAIQPPRCGRHPYVDDVDDEA